MDDFYDPHQRLRHIREEILERPKVNSASSIPYESIHRTTKQTLGDLNNRDSSECPCDGPLTSLSITRHFQLAYKFMREAEQGYLSGKWDKDPDASEKMRQGLLKVMATAISLMEKK